MITLRRLPVLAAAIVALACNDDPTAAESLATARNLAKSRWEMTKPVAYRFEAYRVCECLSNAVGPVIITVTNGQITSVVRKDDGSTVDASLWFTIDGLFALIDTEINTRPSRLSARYDTSRGFPTYVAYGEREVDGGAEILVSAFVVTQQTD